MADPRPTRILVWMCVFIAVNQLGFGAIVPVVALYARSFGVRQAAIGVAIAVYGLARFLVAVPVGKLTDVLGRRAALALGGVVTAAGNLLCGCAPNFTTFVVARFIAGAGAALVLIAGQIVLADITTPERRGRVMAIYQGVFLFAVGVGPYPGGLLAERFGLAAPFLIYAGAGVLASAVAWLQIPDTRQRRPSAEAVTTPPPFAAQVRLLVSHPGFLLVSLVGFMSAVVRTGAPLSRRLVVRGVSHRLRGVERGRRRQRRRAGRLRGRRGPARHERGCHEHLSDALGPRLRDRPHRARRRHRSFRRRRRADHGGGAHARRGRALRPLRA